MRREGTGLTVPHPLSFPRLESQLRVGQPEGAGSAGLIWKPEGWGRAAETMGPVCL